VNSDLAGAFAQSSQIGSGNGWAGKKFDTGGGGGSFALHTKHVVLLR